MIARIFVVLAFCAGLAAAAVSQPSAPAKAAPPPRDAAPQAPTAASIYDVDRLRDPFLKESATAITTHHKFNLNDFSIHNLTLKGIMADRSADFALFSDNSYGYTMILRKGRLLDPRGRVVPGVTGRLNVKKRTASLQTRDGDVQIFKLGVQSMD